jgi:hypothetical protein
VVLVVLVRHERIDVGVVRVVPVSLARFPRDAAVGA